MNGFSKPVTKDLNLDMVAVWVKALHEYSSVFEDGLITGFDGCEGCLDLINIFVGLEEEAIQYRTSIWQHY